MPSRILENILDPVQSKGGSPPQSLLVSSSLFGHSGGVTLGFLGGGLLFNRLNIFFLLDSLRISLLCGVKSSIIRFY